MTTGPGVVGKVKVTLLPLMAPVGANGLPPLMGNPVPRLVELILVITCVPPVELARVKVPVPMLKSSTPMSALVIMRAITHLPLTQTNRYSRNQSDQV